MRSRLLSLALFLCAIVPLPAQQNVPFPGAIEVEQSLAKLNNLGTVLMIAAHPDDEQTAVLAYFARGRHMRTAYLSLTRGEGGQNLIGSEQGPALGVIRTQELLAARKIDGAQQFFTRAIDFGFTKTAAETFEKWGHERILSDVVWVVRRYRPDVVILVFSGTPADGHGQHQVSAILGKEAFEAAADPARFPEQLKWVQPWHAKRLVRANFNFAAFRGALPPGTQLPTFPNLTSAGAADTGAFNPVLGYSYQETRHHEPQHASQPGNGRGAASWRRRDDVRAGGRRQGVERSLRRHRHELEPRAGRCGGSAADRRGAALLRYGASRKVAQRVGEGAAAGGRDRRSARQGETGGIG